MTALPLVILGSARPDGETRKAVSVAFPSQSINLITLAHHHIGGYDYAHANTEDDFGAAADAMHAADKIVFATPGTSSSSTCPSQYQATSTLTI